MIGLFGLFAECGMGPPMVVEFTWFYSIKANKNDEGFYYFSKRPTKGLQAVTRSRKPLVTGRSLISTPQRFRSRAPLVGHVSNLLGLPLN